MWDSKRDTDVKNRLWTLWEKARVGWFERTALNHVCEIDRQSTFEAWDRVLGAGATGMTVRDGMGREGRGGVQDGEHMYTHDWFMSMHGKNHYNVVK